MQVMGDDHVSLFVDEFEALPCSSHGNFYLQCRICHEEEYESCNGMEVPCACTGTVKFAHRDCIQQWCNEKGSTICEICLQNYEAGYTVPEKKSTQQIDVIVTIGPSYEIPTREHTIQNLRTVTIDEGELISTSAYLPNPSSTNTSVSFLSQVALIFTGLLILGQFYDLVSIGAEKYAFSLLTVLVLKISGIIVPMYMVMRGLLAIQNSINKYQQFYQRHDDDEIFNVSHEHDEERRQDRSV